MTFGLLFDLTGQGQVDFAVGVVGQAVATILWRDALNTRPSP